MATLYVMCGAPGCGKSTFCKNNVPKEDLYVSRDEVRYSMLKPNDSYFSKEKEVFNEFVRQIKAGLDAGKNVWADATHLNYGSRAKLINAVGRNEYDFQALVIKVPLETCLLRNSQRSGRAYVPEDSIEEMYHKFTIPTYNEGFSKIWIKEEK